MTREKTIHERFHMKNLGELKSTLKAMDLSLPIDKDLSILGDTITVAGKSVPNRFAVQPMEGFDSTPNGAPSELSHRRYQRYAKGGFGLIWFEATAVMGEARSNPGQLWIHGDNVSEFRKLVEATRETAMKNSGRDIMCILQLTHSGRYSKPDGVPAPIIAHHSPILDPKHNLPSDYPLVTDDYLDQLRDTYTSAARLAADAGFDGIDIKSCHRYLVSELLASFTREGKYGGSLENRSRLLRETLMQIKKEVPELIISTRMNAYDAISYPYGFGVDKEDHKIPDLTEPLQVIKSLCDIGISILNISIGNPYFNPQYGRPYDFPTKGASVPNDHPLAGIERFVSITRQIQKAFPDLPVIGSGYTWLRHLMPYVSAGIIRSGGATIMGIGRGAFAYPDTPKDIIENGKMDPSKSCVTCSACTQIMRDGGKTGCVVRDSEVYGTEYRLARRFAIDNLREQAIRCRDCEEATCSRGCPAHIDVPAFIKAFADGDIRKSYNVLKASNVLPEMCAHICPAEVQCEGACVEDIFCKQPVPIRDIQMVVCRQARRQGLTGLNLPKKTLSSKTAIVGAGPAGIASAIVLLEKGHHVTLFEKSGSLGGTPDNTIPSFRYLHAHEEIDTILAPALEAKCLDIKFNQELGTDISINTLKTEYDAVLLAVGLDRSMSLEIDGDYGTDALTFLKDVKNGNVTSIPDRIAIIGGGNTAMDAAVTACRMGANDVYLVYRRSFAEMPAWPSEREQFIKAGGHCLVLTQPTGYEVKNNNIVGLKIARTTLGEPDSTGRRRPVIVPDSESILAVDMIIEAVGQKLPKTTKTALDDLASTKWGLIENCPDSFETSVSNVFAAGDLVNGGTTAVQAIAEGMKAGKEIHNRLTQKGQ
ncbi:MAG: FAD-dependent oxidoreductase [Kiritimatiellae bacterium]|nr:FAD-dependent oxidoreductase [Kiritimatiellia bacterium]